MKKYYDIRRKQNKKQRVKLMRMLDKSGYTDADKLKIVDALAGRTNTGKENASAEIIKLLSDGAEKEEIFRFIGRYGEQRYVLPE